MDEDDQDEAPILAMIEKLREEVAKGRQEIREIMAEREAIANHFKKPQPKSQS